MLPSDFVDGGVGYRAHQQDRYYEWMRERSEIHLFDRLGEAGWNIRLHHHLEYQLRMWLGCHAAPD
jgi:hypothetical protein